MAAKSAFKSTKSLVALSMVAYKEDSISFHSETRDYFLLVTSARTLVRSSIIKSTASPLVMDNSTAATILEVMAFYFPSNLNLSMAYLALAEGPVLLKETAVAD